MGYGSPGSGTGTARPDRVESLGLRISKSEDSRICQGLDEQADAFRNRPLEGRYPYLWLARKSRRSVTAAAWSGSRWYSPTACTSPATREIDSDDIALIPWLRPRKRARVTRRWSYPCRGDRLGAGRGDEVQVMLFVLERVGEPLPPVGRLECDLQFVESSVLGASWSSGLFVLVGPT